MTRKSSFPRGLHDDSVGRRIAILACFLVLSTAGLTGRDALAQSTSEQTVSVDACESQWNQSDAQSSCSNSVIAVQAEQCRIETSCYFWHSPGYNGNQDNTGVYSLADVASLKNCNGSLTVADCPGPTSNIRDH